ncbi:GvpL/GvpF family gas vesicle protein [Neobacillus vireti]|uniref:GvpL/GvpF family gas vesicle protein n=1 Tax=Neobacillus vireti TaxID=220686 RepID=UPI002FFF3B4E
MASTRIVTDYLYLYGVILAEELQDSEVPSILGIDGKLITIKKYIELAAIFTPVSADNFSQQQIDLQLKDPEWLKEKAFHHHEMISEIHKHFTVLPMSFCTVFQNIDNLEVILDEQYSDLFDKLVNLKGQQEWNVKVYSNKEKTLSYIQDYHPTVVELKEKIPSMPKGKQFIMKKKLEQLIASQVEIEQAKWWKEISCELTSYVKAVNYRKIWGRDVTDRTDDMMVNCDFLVEKKAAPYFFDKIQVLERKYEELGCTFQLTGPWPPYHFSKIVKETL